MPLTDAYEVRLQQSFPGVDIVLNVFHYRHITGGGSATGLATVFNSNVVTEIKKVQVTSLLMVSVSATNLGTLLDTATINLANAPGLRPGDPAPRFMAWGIRLPRTSAQMRHGYKRFCGISESDVTAGQPTSTINTTFQTAVLPALSAVLGGEYQPIVIKRIKYQTAEGKDAWRTPRLSDPYEFYDVTSAILLGVTTQNTRKT